jgi:hypothetical protein
MDLQIGKSTASIEAQIQVNCDHPASSVDEGR